MSRLVVCCIFKDEAPNLAEWLAFHLVVGVEHFYLYNNDSADDWVSAVRPFRDVITVVDRPGRRRQYPVYREALEAAKQDEWAAFIDVDEYLWSPELPDLKDVLRRYETVPGVGAHWMCFGPSGHNTRPPGLTIEGYVRRAARVSPVNAHVKAVVRPGEVVRFIDSHHCLYKDGTRGVDEYHRPLDGPKPTPITHDILRVNHYFTRSREEWRAKVLKGRVDINEPRKLQEIIEFDRIDVQDDAIVKFAPRVRNMLQCRTPQSPSSPAPATAPAPSPCANAG